MIEVGPAVLHVYWTRTRRREDPQIRVDVLPGDDDFADPLQSFTLKELDSEPGFVWRDLGYRNVVRVEGVLRVSGAEPDLLGQICER